MKWNPITRRHFLEGMGKTLALPLLQSLLPAKALAQISPGIQKNFIGIQGRFGAFRSVGPKSILMPPASPSGGMIPGFGSVALPGKHNVHHKSLLELRDANGGKISELIDSSFNPYLSKTLMLQGFDYMAMDSHHHSGNFGNQATGGAWNTGNRAMATIDQVMAYSPGFYKNPALLKRSVVYSSAWQDYSEGISSTWENPMDRFNSPIIHTPSVYDPVALWDSHFGTQNATSNLRLTLVDRVLSDYKSLRSNPRLGGEDRQKLDQHISLLFDTENRIRNVAGSCNTLRPATNLSDKISVIRAMNDVIVSLIACGRVHSFVGYCNIDFVTNDINSFHTWSHEGYSNDTDSIINQLSYDNYVGQLRAVLKEMCLDLVAKLDAAGQLDNSVILYIQEHSKRGHEAWNVPAIMWGSAGGVFKTGQYIDYRNLNGRDDDIFTRFGFPINQLWANVLRAVDVPVSEYEALNTANMTNPLFVSKSGYSVSRFLPESVSFYGQNYTSGWQGHNLSDWLPAIKA